MELNVGDVIFGRVIGHPWWPAIVSLHPGSATWIGRDGRVWCTFVNDSSGAWLNRTNIRPFDAFHYEQCMLYNRGNHKYRRIINRIDLAVDRAKALHKMHQSPSADSERQVALVPWRRDIKDSAEGEVVHPPATKSIPIAPSARDSQNRSDVCKKTLLSLPTRKVQNAISRDGDVQPSASGMIQQQTIRPPADNAKYVEARNKSSIKTSRQSKALGNSVMHARSAEMDSAVIRFGRDGPSGNRTAGKRAYEDKDFFRSEAEIFPGNGHSSVPQSDTPVFSEALSSGPSNDSSGEQARPQRKRTKSVRYENFVNTFRTDSRKPKARELSNKQEHALPGSNVVVSKENGNDESCVVPVVCSSVERAGSSILRLCIRRNDDGLKTGSVACKDGNDLFVTTRPEADASTVRAMRCAKENNVSCPPESAPLALDSALDNDAPSLGARIQSLEHPRSCEVDPESHAESEPTVPGLDISQATKHMHCLTPSIALLNDAGFKASSNDPNQLSRRASNQARKIKRARNPVQPHVRRSSRHSAVTNSLHITVAGEQYHESTNLSDKPEPFPGHSAAVNLLASDQNVSSDGKLLTGMEVDPSSKGPAGNSSNHPVGTDPAFATALGQDGSGSRSLDAPGASTDSESDCNNMIGLLSGNIEAFSEQRLLALARCHEHHSKIGEPNTYSTSNSIVLEADFLRNLLVRISHLETEVKALKVHKTRGDRGLLGEDESAAGLKTAVEGLVSASSAFASKRNYNLDVVARAMDSLWADGSFPITDNNGESLMSVAKALVMASCSRKGSLM